MTSLVKKTIAAGACLALAGGAAALLCPRHDGIREAEAFVRHPVARTAVAVGVVASTSANASAAAEANAQAQAAQAEANAQAQANAAAAARPSQPVGPPPVGSIVTTLPPGCTQARLNDVDYQRCGNTYYRPSMMGSNLVFVVAQP
jgi:hypothetical protein